jgi:hypothetical protein
MQLEATIASDHYDLLTAQPKDQCAGLNPDTAATYEVEAEGRKCLTGMLFAFGFEIAVALCVLGVWQLAHSLR